MGQHFILNEEHIATAFACGNLPAPSAEQASKILAVMPVWKFNQTLTALSVKDPIAKNLIINGLILSRLAERNDYIEQVKSLCLPKISRLRELFETKINAVTSKEAQDHQATLLTHVDKLADEIQGLQMEDLKDDPLNTKAIRPESTLQEILAIALRPTPQKKRSLAYSRCTKRLQLLCQDIKSTNIDHLM
ncbi:hypothetical protein D3C87_348090 [compost metagenome]